MTKPLTGNEPAFPCELPVPGNRRIGWEIYPGMPLRLHLAALAMQGLLADPDYKVDASERALLAIEHADALLSAYNETGHT